MADIDLNTKTDIPLLNSGALRVHLAISDPSKELTPTSTDLFSLDFSAGGNFSFGAQDSFKLGIDAKTKTRLAALWNTSAPERLMLLDNYGLKDYFDAGAHSERLLLLLDVGGSADLDFGGKFKYLNLLNADFSLQAGADASYTLLRSYGASTPAGALIKDFFKGLRLPANIDQPLAEDEVLIFEYGGYLNLGASLGVGYEIGGSQDINISALQFVEKYNFSLMAKIGLSAKVAGRFRVEVRPGADKGWAHIVVRKQRTHATSVAADVKAGVTIESEDFPQSANDFLSALIGLNSKNWLNLFDQVRKYTDFNQLELYLDNLAKSFIETFTNKAFKELEDQAKFNEVLNQIRQIVDAYKEVGDHAVTLFDKYFDVAKNAVDGKLEQALTAIKAATSWDAVREKINKDPIGSIIGEVVDQLTEGDPLGWMLGQIQLGTVSVDSLDEIKKRADKVLALIQDAVHQKIRDFIALAKSKFPLDGLVNELRPFLDPAKLQSLAERRLYGFAERLIGQGIKELKASELGRAVDRLHKVLDAVNDFNTKLRAKVEEALNQSFEFHLHAEHNRSTDEHALLDFELDLTKDKGKELMRAAGKGDFAQVLAQYQTGVVKLHEGVLSHKVTRESKFSVDVVGWHFGAHYQGLDRLITQTEQQIIPERDGVLTIITTIDLEKEKERINRHRERLYTNLLLRFLGESQGAVDFDPDNKLYLVDAITGMSANYRFVIHDPDTDQGELARYLDFADDFGLTQTEDGAFAALTPLLPTDPHGHFGDITVSYEVRFTEQGLRSLFTKAVTTNDVDYIRYILRLIVLANSTNKGATRADRAWAYWTPAVHDLWVKLGPSAFTNVTLNRTFDKIAPSPLKNLKSPASVKLPQSELLQLHRLYTVEQNLVEGIITLTDLVRPKFGQPPAKVNPAVFEQRLGKFGEALQRFDSIDGGDNTIFALFDKLIQRNMGDTPFRNSSLNLEATLNGDTKKLRLIAPVT